MTVSEELREWALYDKLADVRSLGLYAWDAIVEWRGVAWFSVFDDSDLTRTFALLVAEELETHDETD